MNESTHTNTLIPLVNYSVVDANKNKKRNVNKNKNENKEDFISIESPVFQIFEVEIESMELMLFTKFCNEFSIKTCLLARKKESKIIQSICSDNNLYVTDMKRKFSNKKSQLNMFFD